MPRASEGLQERSTAAPKRRTTTTAYKHKQGKAPHPGALEQDEPRMTTFTFRKPSALPGFGLTLGITVAYLSLVVLIPLAATFAKTAK